jgi:hypothetical protein
LNELEALEREEKELLDQIKKVDQVHNKIKNEYAEIKLN